MAELHCWFVECGKFWIDSDERLSQTRRKEKHVIVTTYTVADMQMVTGDNNCPGMDV